MEEVIQKSNKDNEDLYFKSQAHRYIFALVELDGESRQRVLDINDELYHDKEKAKKWRDNIVKLIHPDSCKIEDMENAMAKLNYLYSRMIKDE